MTIDQWLPACIYVSGGTLCNTFFNDQESMKYTRQLRMWDLAHTGLKYIEQNQPALSHFGGSLRRLLLKVYGGELISVIC
jgi:hypothetical protein